MMTAALLASLLTLPPEPCRALQPGDTRQYVTPWVVEDQTYTPKGWLPTHQFNRVEDKRLHFIVNPRTGVYYIAPDREFYRPKLEWEVT